MHGGPYFRESWPKGRKWTLAQEKLCYEHSDSKHPAMYTGFEYQSAMLSTAALYRWFEEKHRRSMKEAGFVLACYDIPDEHVTDPEDDPEQVTAILSEATSRKVLDWLS